MQSGVSLIPDPIGCRLPSKQGENQEGKGG